MDLVYVPDHKAVAHAALLQQYQQRPRIRALVAALAEGVQSTEDEGFDVLISTTLETAQGVNLDQWGALVGEVRGGLSDADYRVFISARILANNSQGTTDEVIAIWALVVAPYIVIRQASYQPATFLLDVLRDVAMNDDRARRVGQLLRDVKPAGIAMMLIESTPGYLGFDEDLESLPLDVGHFSRTL